MAVGAMPYVVGSNTHPARVFRNALAGLLGQPATSHANSASATTRGGSYGVVGDDDFKVTSTGSLGYSVAVGRACGPGTFALAQGAYAGYNDAAVTGNVGARDATNPRIDYIVWRVRDTDEDATGSEDNDVAVIAGTPASSPTAPSVPSSLGTLVILCEVLVPSTANGGALTFTDRRFWVAAVGGIQPVRSTQRPTSTARTLSKTIYEIDTLIPRMWDGSAWRQFMTRYRLNGITRLGDFHWEGANEVVTTDASGDATIGYAEAFGADPVVIAVNGEPANAVTFTVHAVSTTNFKVRVRVDADGSIPAAGPQRCQWVAMGVAVAVTS